MPDGADPALGRADEVFVVSGHPLGAPSRQVASSQRDFTTAVLPQADRFSAASLPGEAAALAAGSEVWSAADLLARVRAAAQELPPGVRLLSADPWNWPASGLDVLLAPLAAGGSLVAVDPAWATPDHLVAIAAAERVTWPRDAT